MSVTKKTATKKKPRSKPGGGTPVSRTALQTLLKKIEERFESEDVKATVADYIRLLQFNKEFEDGRPKSVEVRWVETLGPEDAGEK